MITLLFYGHDGTAAKVQAAAMHERNREGRVRIIHAEVCLESQKCNAISFMPDVTDFERNRISEMFGMEETPVDAIPPAPPLDPLDALPQNWREIDAANLVRIAAAVNGGRTVEDKDQAIAEIEAAFMKRAPK